MADDTVPIACPVCSAEIPSGVLCPSCGAELPEETARSIRHLVRALKVDPGKARALYEMGFRKSEDLDGVDLAQVLAGDERVGVVQVCPSCGAILNSKEVKCTTCGEDLRPQPRELLETHAPDLLLCPNCGAFMAEGVTACPKCGAVIEAVEDAPAAAAAAPEAGRCGDCGATLTAGEVRCSVCGTPVSPAAMPLTCEECGAFLDAGAGRCGVCGAFVGAPVVEVVKPPLERRPTAPSPSPPPPPLPAALQPRPGAAPVAYRTPVPPPPPALAPPLAQRPLPAAAPAVAVPSRPAPPRAQLAEARPRRAPVPRLLQTPELFVLGAAGALAAAFAAGALALPGAEWAAFLAAGAVLGVGLALLASRNLRDVPWRSAWPLLVGAALLFAFAALQAAADLPGATTWPLLAAGLLFAVAGNYPLARRGRPVVLAVLGGALLLLASLPTALAPAGGSGILTPLGSAAVALVAANLAWIGYHRYLRFAVDARVLYADASYRRREYRESVGAYDDAIKRASQLPALPGTEAAWYGKGAALAVLGRHEEAQQCVDTALQINPRNEVAWVTKGNVLARLGRHDEALRCYDRALALNGKYEVAWNNKGNTLARLKRYDEALRCYDKAVGIDERYREAWINKGYILARLGDYENAAKCADTVLGLARGAA